MGGDERSRLDVIRVWYNRWYRLVSNYSSRRLTFSDDIFPALSGLAVAFNVYLQDEYIAGLFWKDILLGLLWETNSDEQAERAMPFRAPTWSWASMKCRVRWPTGMLESANLVLLAKPLSYKVEYTKRSRDKIFKYAAQISSAEIRLSGWLRNEQSFKQTDSEIGTTVFQLDENTQSCQTARKTPMLPRCSAGKNSQRDDLKFNTDRSLFLVVRCELDARMQFHKRDTKRDDDMINTVDWSYEEITLV